MEEDPEFNRFLRESLESASAFTVRPAILRRPSRLRWTVPTLLAATLALAAVLHATFSSRADRVSEAIELLSLTDGVEVSGESAADLLLAWQDAPCAVDL